MTNVRNSPNLDEIGREADPIDVAWDHKDCLLYALGVGAGQTDPTGFELEFTTENSHNTPQRVLPTFPTVVGFQNVIDFTASKGPAQVWGEFDMSQIFHGATTLRIHRPIPTEAEAVVVNRVIGVDDKGQDAVIRSAAVTSDRTSGEPYFTIETSVFFKGQGGFSGDRGPSTTVVYPERAPDYSLTYATRPDQALLYRLSGDRSPHHSDPAFAKTTPVGRPFFQGLLTYGVVGRALMHTLCDSDPDQFESMSARYVMPVFGGDDITTNMWVEDGGIVFRAVNQNGAVVLDSGRLSLNPANG